MTKNEYLFSLNDEIHNLGVIFPKSELKSIVNSREKYGNRLSRTVVDRDKNENSGGQSASSNEKKLNFGEIFWGWNTHIPRYTSVDDVTIIVAYRP